MKLFTMINLDKLKHLKRKNNNAITRANISIYQSH